MADCFVSSSGKTYQNDKIVAAAAAATAARFKSVGSSDEPTMTLRSQSDPLKLNPVG